VLESENNSLLYGRADIFQLNVKIVMTIDLKISKMYCLRPRADTATETNSDLLKRD